MQTPAIDYQALYEQALLEAQKAQTIINDLQDKLALTLFELNRTRRLLFGRSADNRASKANDPNQITLFDLSASKEDLQVSDALAKQEAENIAKEGKAKAAPKQRENNKRMDLPADLPRQEVTIHPDVDLTDYVQIGEEVSEMLEITPASFYVKRIVRTKWARKTLVIALPGTLSENIVIAPLPARTVARGLFGDSLLAYLVISKYADHIPLHRLIKIFERVGIRLAASTLSDNIAAVCRLLEPLYNSLRREVLANRYIQCDETRLRVQDGEKPGACHGGGRPLRLYLGLSRSGCQAGIV